MTIARASRARPEEAPLAAAARAVSGLSGWRAGLASIAVGATGALAMAPFHIWPFLVVGLTFLVWQIDGAAAQKRRLLSGFYRGWCFGFGYFFAGLWWIGSAFLVEADRYGALMPFAITAMPVGLALFWGAAGAIAARLWRRDSRRILLFATILFILEYVRGHVLTGFPWNLVGQTWAAGGVVSQSAAYFGVWGLTFVTQFAFMAPAALGGPDAQPARRITPLAGAFAIFALIVAVGFARVSGAANAAEEGVRLRIVQAQIDQSTKWLPENRDAVRDHYLRLTASEGLETRTHVIWAESALPVLLLEEPRIMDAIARTVGDGRVLLTGAVRRDVSDPLEPSYFNSFVALAIEDGIPVPAAVYDKVKLVPFGEYTPFAQTLRRWIPAKVVDFADGYTHGPARATVTVPGAPPLAPQICYEVIFPGFTLRNGSDRPGWIVNVTNDAWYTGTPGPHQLFNQARYRAIEEGVALARAAAGGYSAVVDPYGRIVAQLPIDADAVVDADLPKALSPTLYSMIGDAIPLVMAGFGLFFGLRRRAPARRRSR